MGDVLSLRTVVPLLIIINYDMAKNRNILPFSPRRHSLFVSWCSPNFVYWTKFKDNILSLVAVRSNIVQWTMRKTTFSLTITTRRYCPMDNSEGDTLPPAECKMF